MTFRVMFMPIPSGYCGASILMLQIGKKYTSISRSAAIPIQVLCCLFIIGTSRIFCFHKKRKGGFTLPSTKD
jgi:hypothetical protein